MRGMTEEQPQLSHPEQLVDQAGEARQQDKRARQEFADRPVPLALAAQSFFLASTAKPTGEWLTV